MRAGTDGLLVQPLDFKSSRRALRSAVGSIPTCSRQMRLWNAGGEGCPYVRLWLGREEV